MTRAWAGALVAIALVAGLGLRLARLDARPMHHDEANQAVKFGALLEHGEYRYDAHDHHGPTLYYLSLPAAWLRGQTTLASLDEPTLRGVTAGFGAATILLLPLLAGIGRTAIAGAALLLAVSPAMVFYSRMYIQESLFACFTLAFVIALGRAGSEPGWRWPLLAGLAAGLAIATKETSVIVLPAAVLAYALAARMRAGGTSVPPVSGTKTRLAVGLLTAATVAAAFYSSLLANPAGVLEPFRGAGTYLERGVEPADHAHPWHYYISLLAWSSSGGLTWSEGLVLALAALGVGHSLSGQGTRSREAVWWARYLAGYSVITVLVFSAIPYKTPWNLLPFYVGAIVLAGIGLSSLVEISRSRVVRAALAGVITIAVFHLGWQAWRASVTYAADPRNPYVYAHTVPDAVRMAARIRDLAAVHPDGARMQVSVLAPPHQQWPLPWYLRTMPHVGYWPAPGDAAALQAPVIVSSLDHTAVLDAALGDGYISEFFGLRPEVLLALYIERGLWDRFLVGVATARPCGPAPAVALWRPEPDPSPIR